jgi:hypothetical protein
MHLALCMTSAKCIRLFALSHLQPGMQNASTTHALFPFTCLSLSSTGDGGGHESTVAAILVAAVEVQVKEQPLEVVAEL